MSFANKVIDVIERHPGISDRHLSEVVSSSVQQVNSECRHLENLGRVERKQADGLPMGNYLVRKKPA